MGRLLRFEFGKKVGLGVKRKTDLGFGAKELVFKGFVFGRDAAFAVVGPFGNVVAEEFEQACTGLAGLANAQALPTANEHAPHCQAEYGHEGRCVFVREVTLVRAA